MSDCYRQCASVVLLRTSQACSPKGCENLIEILLLRKPRKRDAWQLPQGGIEKGETIEEAAMRELMEEASLEATIMGTSERFYQYDFPVSYRRFRPDHVCGQRIRYVFAVPKGEGAVRVDGKEIEGFVWTTSDRLGQFLKRKEYRALVLDLIHEGVRLLRSDGK